MVTPAVSINPSLVTNAPGLFTVTETGAMQGTPLDDPATRFALSKGSLASTETLPIWGGVGIYENIPLATGDAALGGAVGRATALTNLTGFTTWSANWLSSPQSPVPVGGSSNTVTFWRLGSGQRIWLAIDPALVNLDGSLITSQVSWDYTSQRIVQYEPAYAANTITGATWANTSGGQTTFTVSSNPTSYATAGATIDVSGVISTGGTGVGYNGAFIVVSSTSTTIVVTQLSASSPGTYSSGGTVAAGGGALPVKILRIQTTGSKTVSFDGAYATWNSNGACAAVIL